MCPLIKIRGAGQPNADEYALGKDPLKLTGSSGVIFRWFVGNEEAAIRRLALCIYKSYEHCRHRERDHHGTDHQFAQRAEQTSPEGGLTDLPALGK